MNHVGVKLLTGMGDAWFQVVFSENNGSDISKFTTISRAPKQRAERRFRSRAGVYPKYLEEAMLF